MPYGYEIDMNYLTKLITTHEHGVQNRPNYNKRVAVVRNNTNKEFVNWMFESVCES